MYAARLHFTQMLKGMPYENQYEYVITIWLRHVHKARVGEGLDLLKTHFLRALNV
jgi:hypothetical protein